MTNKKKDNRAMGEKIVIVTLSILLSLTAVYALVRHFIRAPELAAKPEQDATQTDPDSKRRPLCYTILLSGLDDDNGGSDTNILMCFDVEKGNIALVSLPRDTLLDHEWASNKLNYAYAKGGTDLICSEISNLLGVPVDFSVTVSLRSFEKIIDQIGGVDFNVPKNMDYDDPYQNLSIHFKKGMQHLDGKSALKVVRWRKNNDGTAYATADIGRIGTQQDFLKAAAAQVMEKLGPDDVPALAQIFFEDVKTDLSVGNLIWLGKEALKIGMDNVHFYTLPGDGTAYYRGESVYALDPAATLTLVNDVLNPYKDPIEAEDMHIVDVG